MIRFQCIFPLLFVSSRYGPNHVGNATDNAKECLTCLYASSSKSFQANSETATMYRRVSKKVLTFGGLLIKKYVAIFKPEMFIYQSKANLGQKILFGKITIFKT